MAFEHVQPGDRISGENLTAFEMNAMKDVARLSQTADGLRPGESAKSFGLFPHVVRVKNTSGAAKNRYSAMSLGDLRWSTDVNANVTELIWAAEAYDEDKPVCVLQEPLDEDAVGLAVVHGPTLIRTLTTADGAARWGTPDSSGDIVPGAGPVRLSQAPNTSSGGRVMLGLLGQASGGEAGRFVLTTDPAGGATGATGDYMTATADIFKVETDGSVTLLAEDVTLYLDYDMFSDLVSGDWGEAVKDSRVKWKAVNAPCSVGGSS